MSSSRAKGLIKKYYTSTQPLRNCIMDPLGSDRGSLGIRGAHSDNRCNKLIQQANGYDTVATKLRSD